MDAEIAVLRLLHILPGVTWVGSAIFLAFIVQPALKKTGPPHAPAVMANMVKPLVMIMHSSAALTIVVGVMMAFRVRDPLFDFLWSTNWGTMIWLGFVLSVIAWVVGTLAGLTGKKLGELGASLQGPPSPEQAAEMSGLQNRSIALAKIAALFALGAVATMALANQV